MNRKNLEINGQTYKIVKVHKALGGGFNLYRGEVSSANHVAHVCDYGAKSFGFKTGAANFNTGCIDGASAEEIFRALFAEEVR